MSHTRQTSDHSPWPTILVIVGAGILAACQVGKVPMALSQVQQDLGLDLPTVSWLISAFAVVGAAAGIITGFAADRIGPKRMALVGLVILAVGSGMGTFSGGASSLVVARIVEGVGFLGVVVAAPTLIALFTPAHHTARAMAIWATFMPVGLTLVMLAAPILNLLSWRGFWALNALLLAAYAVLFGYVVKSQAVRAVQQRPILNDIGETMRASGPWLLGGLFATFAAAYFAVFGFLPAYLSERLTVSAEAASMLSAVAIAVSAAGNIAGGLLRARGYRPTQLLYAGFSIMAICAIGIFNAATPALLIIVLCGLFSLAGGVIPVVLLASAPHSAPRPELVGATMGFIMQGNNIGLLIGPTLTGWAVAKMGWPAVAYLVVIFVCVALGIMAAGVSRRASSGLLG